jgi:hypothetical protein
VKHGSDYSPCYFHQSSIYSKKCFNFENFENTLHLRLCFFWTTNGIKFCLFRFIKLSSSHKDGIHGSWDRNSNIVMWANCVRLRWLFRKLGQRALKQEVTKEHTHNLRYISTMKSCSFISSVFLKLKAYISDHAHWNRFEMLWLLVLLIYTKFTNSYQTCAGIFAVSLHVYISTRQKFHEHSHKEVKKKN